MFDELWHFKSYDILNLSETGPWSANVPGMIVINLNDIYLHKTQYNHTQGGTLVA